MKNISKLVIIVGILLTISGHTPTAHITIDLTPGAHQPPIRVVYLYGWPVPALTVTNVQGCTTTLNLEFEWLAWAVVYNVLFWVAVLYILKVGWPVDV